MNDKNYQFDYDLTENIEKEYAQCNCYDEWGCATLWLNDIQGVEYNLCIDNGNNCSAIYKMEHNVETGYVETDYNTFEHHEINFKDGNWKQELEVAMLNAAEKFFKEGEIK